MIQWVLRDGCRTMKRCRSRTCALVAQLGIVAALCLHAEGTCGSTPKDPESQTEPSYCGAKAPSRKQRGPQPETTRRVGIRLHIEVRLRKMSDSGIEATRLWRPSNSDASDSDSSTHPAPTLWEPPRSDSGALECKPWRAFRFMLWRPPMMPLRLLPMRTPGVV